MQEIERISKRYTENRTGLRSRDEITIGKEGRRQVGRRNSVKMSIRNKQKNKKKTGRKQVSQ